MTWKTVNTNSNYLINSQGDIFSIRANKILMPQFDKDGYQYVKLYNSDTKSYKHYRVHRLVLEAFIGPCPSDKSECHHINGNRSDNRVNNLLWASRKENDSHVKHLYNDGSYKKHQLYRKQ